MSTHAGPSIQTYGTPPHLFEALERELGARFDLDVCAEPWSAKAPRFFTAADDGLTAEWARFNWCNPPYSDQARWLSRAAWWAEACGYTTVSLVRASIDASYWFRLAVCRGTVDLFRGRIAFLDPATRKPVRGSTFASAVVWHGPGYLPGVVRWRDAETGALLNVDEIRELRGLGAA